MEHAQELMRTALLIEHEAQVMLYADTMSDLRTSYAHITSLQETLDDLIINLGRANLSEPLLAFQQSVQIFGSTVNVLAKLHKEVISEGSDLTNNTTLVNNLRLFNRNLIQQGANLITLSQEFLREVSTDYRHLVDELTARSEKRQMQVLILLVSSLALASLLSLFFCIHVVIRLRRVSQHLRSGKVQERKPQIQVLGNDEIGQMARAVEQFMEDRRQLIKTKESLQQNEEMMRAITDAVQSTVLLIDHEGRIRFSNPAVENLFGYSQKELYGSPFHDLFVSQSLRVRGHNGAAGFNPTGTRPVPEKPNELVALRKDGSQVFCELIHSPVQRENELWTVGAAIDISGHKSREKMLTNLAETDPLTGVYNRRGLLPLVEAKLTRCRQTSQPMFFLLFDLDHFKAINDSYGHAVGDEVLRDFAKICANNLRDTDFFGRIGGEEFVAVMIGMGQQDALRAAERIRTAFVDITVSGRDKDIPLSTSVSIGLVSIDLENDTVDSGLHKADTALYQAKEQGRNRVVVG